MSKLVMVASMNPVKIDAARLGFQAMLDAQNFEFQGMKTPSGVSEQPFSDAETLTGAMNRIDYARMNAQQADYWIALEGGVEERGERLAAFAWIVIGDKHRTTQSRTGTFFIPDKVSKLVKEGMELGEADDILFGKTNSKQVNGAIGIFTDDIITRTTLYQHAVMLALAPFRNPHYFD